MRRISTLTLVVGCLTAFGVSAPADESSFQVSCSRTSLSRHGGVYTSTVEGQATHLGPFTGTSVINFPQGHHAVGPLIINGSGGDSLTLYTDVWFDKHFIAGYGTYVITGGTGRFEGATGNGSFQVVHDNNGTTVISWEGTISH